LSIDREIVKGRGIAVIAREFHVNDGSLYNHSQNHVSRQLAKAWEQKELTEQFNLLSEIDDIIKKAKAIFDRNFAKGHDVTAIKALAEHRNTMELLAKISIALHEKLRIEEQETKASQTEKEKAEFEDKLKVLTTSELEVLVKIQDKIARQDKNTIIIADYTIK
jgi:hypothetical protein